MALNDIQQIKQLLEGKKHILITTRKDAQADSVASSLAMLLFVEALGKRATIVIDEFDLPKTLRFLKKAKRIKSKFSHLQKFIISVDTEKTGVKELSYDTFQEKLRIFITPKQGMISRDDIKTAQSEFAYDLVIAVDTPDLASLGGLYTNNTALFETTPVINIDRHVSNEHYGQINIVDSTMASTTEVLFGVLERLGSEYINKFIATGLLAGMIANTRSFKTDNVKPSTLATAGRLMSLGADREYIIKNLYRTKSVSSLKLWGHALSHLQTDKASGLVWTSITRDDFVRAGAQENELYDVVDELIANSPEAKMILLIHEHTKHDSIHVILSAQKGFDALKTLESFGAKGDGDTATCMIEGKTLREVEEEVVEAIKKNYSH